MALRDRVLAGPDLSTGRSLQGRSAGPVPESCLRYDSNAVYPLLGNDVVGDCSPAALGHILQVQSHIAGGSYVPTTTEALGVYNKIKSPPPLTVPGHSGTFEGCFPSALFKYTAVHGYDGAGNHRAWGKQIPNTRQSLMESIFYLGGAQVTVCLPISAEYQRYYRVTSGPNAAVSSYGNHSVAAVGYNAHGVEIVTWGKLIPVSWAWWDKYVVAATSKGASVWAPLTWDWCPGGTSPNGDTWKALGSRFGFSA